VLQHVAACCSVLQCAAVPAREDSREIVGLRRKSTAFCQKSPTFCQKENYIPSGGGEMLVSQLTNNIRERVLHALNVLHCVALCCTVLQCAVLCCNVLQYVAVCCSALNIASIPSCQCVAVCCSVLQCVAAHQTSHLF